MRSTGIFLRRGKNLAIFTVSCPSGRGHRRLGKGTPAAWRILGGSEYAVNGCGVPLRPLRGDVSYPSPCRRHGSFGALGRSPLTGSNRLTAGTPIPRCLTAWLTQRQDLGGRIGSGRLGRDRQAARIAPSADRAEGQRRLKGKTPGLAHPQSRTAPKTGADRVPQLLDARQRPR
jgi:hypothetical protein